MIGLLITKIIKGQVIIPCKNEDEITCQSYYIPSNCTCDLIMVNNKDGKKNCCCGRDYFFYSFPYADKSIIGFVGSNMATGVSECNRTTFCNRNDYDFVKLNSYGSVGGDWLLIWYDEFDYNVLNQSFYNYLSKEKNYVSTNIVYQNSQIELSNGTLKLKSKYDPNPNSLYSYYGPQILNSSTTGSYCYPCLPRHFDYVLGRIWTDFAFPKNIRIQSKIKCHPNMSNVGTNFWMFGQTGNYQEIDIFESGKFYTSTEPLTNSYYDLHYPNYNITMTYHSTKYQMNNCKRSEGVFRYTGVPLDAYFNQYDLIYDDWKIEWWFNGVVVWRVNKYYNMDNYWGEKERRENFRRKPINKYADMPSSRKVSYNTYFPHIGFPSDIRFDINTLKSNGNLGDVNPSTDMITSSAVGGAAEMDYLKVWIRANCNENRIVSQNNPLLSTSSQMYIIETGKTITTAPGANITISAPVGWGMGSAIYASTEEIEFNDGFGVDETGNLFAFITTCETAWDNNSRLSNLLDSSSTYSDTDIDEDTLEINSNDEYIELKILPIPANDHIHINMYEEDWYDLTKIELITPLGQVKELPKEMQQNISDMSNGIYFLKFYFSSGVIVVKPLMIQR